MSGPAETSERGRTAFPEARVRGESMRNAVHAGLLAMLSVSAVTAYFVAGWTAVFAWAAAVVAPSVGLLAWQRARTASAGAAVEAGEEGLFANGKLVVPRADMIRAVVTTHDSGPVVSIQRKQGFFTVVHVPAEAEGERLVRALGLSAAQRTAEFLVDSPLATRVPRWIAFGSFGLVIVLATLGMWLVSPLSWVVAFAWYLMAAAWLHPITLTIGTDGALLSWFGKKTLLPFSEMMAVVPDKKGLVFEMAGGRKVLVRAEWIARRKARAQPEMASTEVYLATLAERIRQAKEAAGGADVAALERRERPLAEWIAHLRALTDKGTKGFREAPIVAEALWRTVENGLAEPRARAAAAVALGSSLDEPGRARLRVAADVVVAPKLRIALNAAADGDDDALSRALAELEAAALADARAGGARDRSRLG